MKSLSPLISCAFGKSPGLFAGALASALFFVGSGKASAVVVATNGVYDPNTNGNVDSSATSSPNDVATFTSAVLAANAAGFGGVIHFDLPANAAGTTLEATYASAAKTLNISSTPGFNIQTLTSATVLSGRALLTVAADTANDDATFTFGSIDNGAAFEAVTQIGFAILSRSGTGYPQDITVTAFFSDGTSSSIVNNIDSTAGTDDTFFGFTAPAGQSITGFTLNPPNDGSDSRLIIDDLGFITSIVPEPSTSLLGCGGLAVLLARRRRNA